MNCPRCKTPIGPLANPDSIVTCPGCGSRLMTRSAALRSQGSTKSPATTTVAAPAFPPPSPPPPEPPPSPKPEPPAPPKRSKAAAHPPSATMPPTSARELGLRPEDARSKPAAADDVPQTIRARAPEEATLELVLKEVRALRETQQLVLDALEALKRRPAAPAGAAPPGEDEAPTLSPIRARRQKTVVLVDDDPETREAAVAELLRANVPVRAYAEGNAALAAIAEEKPDVIALEISLSGDVAGRDLVNMIKATMEWVDIPIILWTREGVAGQKEARLVHGADEVVLKTAGPGALVARVITIFRRG